MRPPLPFFPSSIPNSRLAPALVVLEATGGFEVPAKAGYAVAVVYPRQAHNFAKATGRLAKNNWIDAWLLAHFGEAVRPQPRPLPRAEAVVLNALPARRHQILAMLTMETNHLPGCRDGRVRAHQEAHVSWLRSRLEESDKALEEAVKSRGNARAEGIDSSSFERRRRGVARSDLTLSFREQAVTLLLRRHGSARTS